MANDLNFQYSLGIAGPFVNRVLAAALNAAMAVSTETVNDVQVVTVTGTPTGGSFTLAGLPGVTTLTISGATTNAAATVTGLNSTRNLFVGMSVTGPGIPLGATIATITSTSAITISANATASATVAIVFSGVPTITVAFNDTAGAVQNKLKLAMGGGNNVVCTGGPLPGTPITATLVGDLAGQPFQLMTLGTNSLTGGSSPTATITRGTVGVAVAFHAQRQAFANNFIKNPDAYMRSMSLAVASNSTVQADFTSAGALVGGKTETDAFNDISFVVNGLWNLFSLSQ